MRFLFCSCSWQTWIYQHQPQHGDLQNNQSPTPPPTNSNMQRMQTNNNKMQRFWPLFWQSISIHEDSIPQCQKKQCNAQLMILFSMQSPCSHTPRYMTMYDTHPADTECCVPNQAIVYCAQGPEEDKLLSSIQWCLQFASKLDPAPCQMYQRSTGISGF